MMALNNGYKSYDMYESWPPSDVPDPKRKRKKKVARAYVLRSFIPVICCSVELPIGPGP